MPGPATPPRKARPTIRNRCGVLCFATVFIIIAPLFPVFVEALKSGDVRPETYPLTAAVLAVGYGFASQDPLFWAAYALLFFASLGYDFKPEAVLPTLAGDGIVARVIGWIMGHLSLSLMLAVTMLQFIERFIWHMVSDRQFPDWGK
jgi:hypothetical protein